MLFDSKLYILINVMFTNLGSHYASLDKISLLSPSLGSRLGSPLLLLDVVALSFAKAIP